MSLRVLLADESDTIKKVFQLALQDFNAEVKAVHSGLDVIDVALTFKPDIVFADVLLQKKNGYDTCLEIKQHLKLKTIPVVLMWSSFMELDQGQFKRSQANDQLEKPFDADFLRGLIKKYVPSVAENPMADFLSFPKSITEDLQKEITNVNKPLAETSFHEDASEFNKAVLATSTPPPKATSPIKNDPIILPPPTFEKKADISLPSFSNPSIPQPAANTSPKITTDDKSMSSSFAWNPPKAPAKESQKTSSPSAGAIPLPPPSLAEENWKTTDLSKFKVDEDLKSDNLDKFESLNLTQEPQSSPTIPPELSAIDIFKSMESLSPEPSQHSPSSLPTTPLSTPPLSDKDAYSGVNVAPGASSPMSTTGLDDSEIEAIVRAHTEEFIKTEFKKSLFDLMEKIVREELNKVLEEEIRLKQELSSDQP